MIAAGEAIAVTPVGERLRSKTVDRGIYFLSDPSAASQTNL